MADKEKIINIQDHLVKSDLNLILETNRRAIELDLKVAEQNEDVIEDLFKIQGSLSSIDNKNNEIIKLSNENKKLSEDHAKDLFQMKVLFIVGLLQLVMSIISIFLKK